MGAMASQITSLTIVYSTVYSGADQRRHQSSASLAFMRGIHRWPVNSPHKWPVMRKMFPFDDVIMQCHEDVLAWKCFLRYWSVWWETPVTYRIPSQRASKAGFDGFFEEILKKKLLSNSRVSGDLRRNDDNFLHYSIGWSFRTVIAFLSWLRQESSWKRISSLSISYHFYRESLI